MTRSALSVLGIAAALVLAAPAASAEPDWGHATRMTVELSSFAYAPRTIALTAGQPVLLHLVNTGSGGHDFTAPKFFAAAAIRAGDTARIRKGSIEVPGRGSVDVALVPGTGRFPLRCGHAFHAVLGMKGTIIVR